MNRIRLAGLLGGLCLGALFCSKAHAETSDRRVADLAGDTAEASISLHDEWIKNGAATGYRPSGWLWFSWPYAYDIASADWYWFHSANAQLVIGPWPTGNWLRMGSSALANGWTYFNWPYAYDWEGQGWYYMNSGDVQWCVNLRTSQWALFGRLSTTPPVIPAGMVFVQGGTGNNVTVPHSFYVGKYEVTWAEWQTVRDWALVNGYSFSGDGGGCDTNHPVNRVNWYDCVKWCNAKSEKELRTPAYTVSGGVYRSGEHNNVDVNTAANGDRLLTWAEWCFAAEGGVLGQGYTYSGGNNIGAVAWYRDNSSSAPCNMWQTRGTWPVGQKAANELGIHDMSGNVSEWGFTLVAGVRVLSGGNWWSEADSCQVAVQTTGAPGGNAQEWGFRIARNAP